MLNSNELGATPTFDPKIHTWTYPACELGGVKEGASETAPEII
jgi:hypothetical protein